MNKCPTCGLPLKNDVKSITFTCGGSPLYVNQVKVYAEWCSNPTCKKTDVFLVGDHQESPDKLTFIKKA